MSAVFFLALYHFASTVNLFKYLRQRYDYELVQDLNHLLNLKGKCVRNREGVLFLQKCLFHHLAPANIRDRVRKGKPRNPAAIERAFIRDDMAKRQEFFNLALEQYRMKLPRICRKLSFLDKVRFCKLLNKTMERLSTRIIAKNDKTLQWLMKTQQGNGVLRHNTITNLSDFQLTEVQKNVLCRGLNFGIPPRVCKEEVLAEFELYWKQLEEYATSDDSRRRCRASLASIAENYANARIDWTGFPLSKEELAVIRELRRNENIVISRPDKGNGVVVLNKADYLKKMEAILADEKKFHYIGDADVHDRTVQQERALQAFLLRAVNAGDLQRDIYERIRPVGTNRPRMYGVPKIHKDDVPLRPILSMVNAPQHKIAKWLAELLKPVVLKYSNFTIKDTFEFCRNMEDFQKENDSSGLFMCSFDITSLFTNIPLEKTFDICLNALYRDESIPRPSVPERLMRKLLLKATTEVEFSFNGQMYRQVDGVAMGSPLGPVLANIFVGFCESGLKENEIPLLYNRFVDDTFSIFESKEKSEDFFVRLNNLDPALCFTVEYEKDGQLPFMDVKLSRINGKFERSVYRKPTFTGMYTRWDSFSPTSQKIALMRSLTSRAHRICSPSTLSEEMKTLQEIFIDNGYPGDLVKRIVQANPASNLVPQQKTTTSQHVTIHLPWIGRTSSDFAKEIRKTVKSSFNEVEPRLIFTTTKAFSGRHKDVLPTTAQSSVIYEFTCRCERTYVGKTSQCLAERIKQHLPPKILAKTQKELVKKKSDSAITRHIKEQHECLSPDLLKQFKVLSKARNQAHLDVLEAIFIRTKSPALCQQKEHVRHLSLV